jgi:hypothetical protein
MHTARADCAWYKQSCTGRIERKRADVLVPDAPLWAEAIAIGEPTLYGLRQLQPSSTYEVRARSRAPRRLNVPFLGCAGYQSGRGAVGPRLVSSGDAGSVAAENCGNGRAGQHLRRNTARATALA